MLKYLTNTKNHVIQYDAHVDDFKTIFLIFSDAIFADDFDIKHNNQKYCLKLFDELIDGKASKQKIVIISSTEVGLLSIFNTDKKLLWWNRFFESIDIYLLYYTFIKCDNKQTIRTFTSETAQFTTKLRHVDVHRHGLRQEIKNKNIIITGVFTLKIIADDLIKALSSQKHEQFLELLGLKGPPNC